MNITMVNEALTIMLIGMGTVFVFLTIMIGVMHLTTFVLKYINKYFPEELPVEKKPAKKKTADDVEIAIAIACAFQQSQKS